MSQPNYQEEREIFIQNTLKDFVECDHQCSGDCRKKGCNCDCGEWHIDNVNEQKRQFIQDIIENL